MESRRKLYCHHDMIRFMTEEILIKEVGKNGIISLSEGKRFELMIFLGKELNSERYEVRVHKASVNDRYIPHPGDGVQSYSENNKYVSFFFEDFEKGIHFISMIPYWHPEYRNRVVKKIVL